MRPESKLRVITIDQVRELSRQIFLKPHEGGYKVALLVDADCLNQQAANALLKTLEEPPERSVLMLLTTQPTRLLDTVVSRCLTVRISTRESDELDPELTHWVRSLVEQLVEAGPGLLPRYKLLEAILQQLEAARALAEQTIQKTGDESEGLESDAQEAGPRSDSADKAAVEAEYRRRREEILTAVLHWLRDVWLVSQGISDVRRCFADVSATERLARRLTPEQALANVHLWEQLVNLLRRTNVQELLALEATLLQLQLGEPAHKGASRRAT